MTSILSPVIVLMLITMLVWLNMFIKRMSALRSLKVDPQAIATPEKLSAALDDKANAPANCFKNMFEVPVIFYAFCIVLAITGSIDSLYSNLAWAFVVFRAIQASVHCTYNGVMHRFYAYLVSSIILWVMLVRFFLSII